MLLLGLYLFPFCTVVGCEYVQTYKKAAEYEEPLQRKGHSLQPVPTVADRGICVTVDRKEAHAMSQDYTHSERSELAGALSPAG